MNEEKAEKGPFGLLLPMGYEVTLKRLPEGIWELVYIEDVDPTLTDEQVKKAVENMAALFGSYAQYTVEEHKIIAKFRGTREACAAALVMEFMAATDFGKMTLSQIMILAGIGSLKVEDFDKLHEKMVKDQATSEGKTHD